MKKSWYSVVVTDDSGAIIDGGNVFSSSSEGAAYLFCEKHHEYRELFSGVYNPNLGFHIDAHLL